jgi:hypothetical protein
VRRSITALDPARSVGSQRLPVDSAPASDTRPASRLNPSGCRSPGSSAASWLGSEKGRPGRARVQAPTRLLVAPPRPWRFTTKAAQYRPIGGGRRGGAGGGGRGGGGRRGLVWCVCRPVARRPWSGERPGSGETVDQSPLGAGRRRSLPAPPPAVPIPHPLAEPLVTCPCPAPAPFWPVPVARPARGRRSRRVVGQPGPLDPAASCLPITDRPRRRTGALLDGPGWLSVMRTDKRAATPRRGRVKLVGPGYSLVTLSVLIPQLPVLRLITSPATGTAQLWTVLVASAPPVDRVAAPPAAIPRAAASSNSVAASFPAKLR